MRTKIIALAAAAAMLAVTAGAPAFAHVHFVTTGNGRPQELASGQNHPGFIGDLACYGTNELPGTGPAGYGLEVAHHGPDSGDPGRGDGCYERDGTPDDQNPAID